MRPSLKTILSAVTGVLVSIVWISAFGFHGSGSRTIDRILTRPDRVLLVFPEDGAWNNPFGCDTSARAALDPAQVSAESFREQCAVILGAHLNGNTVSFGFSGCLSINNVTVPVITNVSIF